MKGRGIRPNFISQPSGIQPWALATDGVHLYWSSGDPWIGRANLDGTQVTPHFIYAGAGQSVYGLAVHGATLYLGEISRTPLLDHDQEIELARLREAGDEARRNLEAGVADPSLEEVVGHYCTGVHRNPNLDPNLGKHPDGGLHLAAADQAALVAFLRTLTDRSFVKSP